MQFGAIKKPPDAGADRSDIEWMVMISSRIGNPWIGLAVSGVLFLLFLHEAYGAQVFFSRYLVEMTKELRNIEPTPKKE